MNALVQQSLDLLQSAVDLRLRSDVPVGLSLSGGLDSSTVAALMCNRQFSPVGFTFGSPKDLESEGPVVREIAESKKIQVNYIWPAPREMADAFWECLEAQDSPFTGGSIIAQYLVFKAARAHGFKVLLGGQGGDEAFMGYRKFLLFRLQNLRANRNYLQTGRTLFDLIPVFFSELRSARDYFLAAKRYRSKEGIRESLRFPEIKPISMSYEGREPLWIRQMHDVLDFSLPTLLRYEDRNSMGNSIESRLPFMDYRTIEFGLALPEALKVRRGFCKWIVREAVQGLVPDSIRMARYKKAFNVKQKEWMKEGLGQSLRQMLHEREASIRDFLPKTTGGIDEAFSEQQLISRPNAFREAVALVWLAKRI